VRGYGFPQPRLNDAVCKSHNGKLLV